MRLIQLILVFLWCLLSSSAYEISRGVNETLYESRRIDLTQSQSKLTLYIRLCKYSVTDTDGTLLIRMSRYCYCRHATEDSSCLYPGPTLELHSDTSIEVLIINNLTGSSSTTLFHNKYKDMDVTNLHTHGLHVNPRVDDVLIQIQPGNNYQQSYSYDIGYHYPGTHWYHAHHHGSTTYQVNAGLHGTILMNTDDAEEMNVTKYKETVLMFNWFYAIPASICNDNKRGGTTTTCPGSSSSNTNLVYNDRFLLFPTKPNLPSANYAMCDIYCKLPISQLLASGYIYDVETNISFNSSIFYLPDDRSAPVDQDLLLFFTNGQISPIIRNLTVGIYHRLRFVNSLSNWYLQFRFPGDSCDWHLIATDGVYIGSDEYKNYNLNHTSHENQLIMSPGGRADVMVRCNAANIYPIYASNDTLGDANLLNLQRIPDGRLLFQIEVNERTDPLSMYNGTDKLPINYAQKKTGSYIEDLSGLTTSTGLQKRCECNYNATPPRDCEVSFFFNNGFGTVNGKSFGYNTSATYPYLRDALTIIEQNKSYQFIINNGFAHVYHQHINPFQIPLNQFIGKNGFIALPQTWWDTLGNYPNNSVANYITMRFWTRDYNGLIITHCHLLQHEDVGMMGFYDILNKTSYICPYEGDTVLVNINSTQYKATNSTTAETTSYYTTTAKTGADAAYHITIIPLCIATFLFNIYCMV